MNAITNSKRLNGAQHTCTHAWSDIRTEMKYVHGVRGLYLAEDRKKERSRERERERDERGYKARVIF